MLLLQLFMFLAMSLSAASFTQSESTQHWACVTCSNNWRWSLQRPSAGITFLCLMDSYSNRIIIIMQFQVPLPCPHTPIMALMKICKFQCRSFPSILAALGLIWISELSGQKDTSFAIPSRKTSLSSCLLDLWRTSFAILAVTFVIVYHVYWCETTSPNHRN